MLRTFRTCGGEMDFVPIFHGILLRCHSCGRIGLIDRRSQLCFLCIENKMQETPVFQRGEAWRRTLTEMRLKLDQFRRSI